MHGWMLVKVEVKVEVKIKVSVGVAVELKVKVELGNHWKTPRVQVKGLKLLSKEGTTGIPGV